MTKPSANDLELAVEWLRCNRGGRDAPACHRVADWLTGQIVPFTGTVRAALVSVGMGSHYVKFGVVQRSKKDRSRILSVSTPGSEWREMIDRLGPFVVEDKVVEACAKRGLAVVCRIGRGSQYPHSVAVQEVLP